MPKHVNLFTYFISLCLCVELSASLIDLEDLRQESVQETRQIQIPGYPDAYNPSIIRWNDSYLLSFKIIPHPSFTFHSFAGVIWLDDDFNPKGNAQILNLRDDATGVPSRVDDGRLMEVGGYLHFVYSDNADPIISRGGFRVFVAQLKCTDSRFDIVSIERLSRFEGQNEKIREKNWVPFEYEEKLLLSYSIVPHVVLKPLLDDSQECITVCKSRKCPQWDWGEIRGGTTALKIDEARYLSFFHSSIIMESIHSDGKPMTHYFMGAYTFDAKPPFAVSHISPEPIIGKDFYHGKNYKPYWKPVVVVFPVGFVFDEESIWVAYGRQDRECWIVKINKKWLLNSLIDLNFCIK